MLKVLKYVAILAPMAEFFDAMTSKAFNPDAEPLELRPSLKGAQFSIVIKRTRQSTPRA